MLASLLLVLPMLGDPVETCTLRFPDRYVLADTGLDRPFLGDVNGDGATDVVSDHGFDLGIWPGRGDGTFDPVVTDDGPRRPATIADLDGDGFDDIVTIENAVICIRWGSADLILGETCVGDVGVPHDVAATDLDGDGDGDLVVGSTTGVIYEVNNDDRVLTSNEIATVLGHTGVLTIGDVNDDGIVDIIANAFVIDEAGQTQGIQVLRGDLDYAPEPFLPLDYEPDAIRAGDLDGDGRDDFIAFTTNRKTMAVRRVDETWDVDELVVIPAWVYDLVLDDMDGDDDLDVIVATTDPEIVTYANDGDAHFAPLTRRPFAADDDFFGLAVGDLDGDVETDVVFASERPDEFSRDWIGIVEDAVIPSAAPTIDAHYGVQRIVTARLDDDDAADVCFANFLTGTIAVARADGAGAFLPLETYDVGIAPEPPAAGDVDDDGDVDFVVTDRFITDVHLLRNDGNGAFNVEVIDAGLTPIRGPALLDHDGNGTLDLLGFWTTSDTDRVAIRNGDGNGGFAARSSTFESGLLQGATIIGTDFEPDGDVDLILCGNKVRTFSNDGDGDFSATGHSHSGTSAVAVDFDGDAHIEVFSAGDGRASVRDVINGSAITDTGWPWGDIAVGQIDDIPLPDFVTVDPETGVIMLLPNRVNDLDDLPIDLGSAPGRPSAPALADIDGDGRDELLFVVLDDDGIAVRAFECAPLDDCPTDLDGDAVTGFSDLLILLTDWGPCAKPCPSDLDGDGEVGVTDLTDLLAAWGACG